MATTTEQLSSVAMPMNRNIAHCVPQGGCIYRSGRKQKPVATRTTFESLEYHTNYVREADIELIRVRFAFTSGDKRRSFCERSALCIQAGACVWRCHRGEAQIALVRAHETHSNRFHSQTSIRHVWTSASIKYSSVRANRAADAALDNGDLTNSAKRLQLRSLQSSPVELTNWCKSRCLTETYQSRVTAGYAMLPDYAQDGNRCYREVRLYVFGDNERGVQTTTEHETGRCSHVTSTRGWI